MFASHVVQLDGDEMMIIDGIWLGKYLLRTEFRVENSF